GGRRSQGGSSGSAYGGQNVEKPAADARVSHLQPASPKSDRTLPALGADLEPGELRDGGAGVVEHGLDRLLVLGDRRLLEEDDLLEEAVEPALGDLGDGLLRLALLAGGRLGDLALVLDHVGRHLVAGEV